MNRNPFKTRLNVFQPISSLLTLRQRNEASSGKEGYKGGNTKSQEVDGDHFEHVRFLKITALSNWQVGGVDDKVSQNGEERGSNAL